MRETYTSLLGNPANRSLKFSHEPPSLWVTQTLPSSVPASSRPGLTYDSASVTTVPYVSAPVTSGVTPPVNFSAVSMRARSCLERSGEMVNISSPRLSDLNTLLPPRYITCGLCGERKNGEFRLKRVCRSVESFRSLVRNILIRFSTLPHDPPH